MLDMTDIQQSEALDVYLNLGSRNSTYVIAATKLIFNIFLLYCWVLINFFWMYEVDKDEYTLPWISEVSIKRQRLLVNE